LTHENQDEIINTMLDFFSIGLKRPKTTDRVRKPVVVSH